MAYLTYMYNSTGIFVSGRYMAIRCEVYGWAYTYTNVISYAMWNEGNVTYIYSEVPYLFNDICQ